MAGLFSKLFSEEQRELASLEKMADKVISYEPEMQKLSDEELADKTTEYKERLANGEAFRIMDSYYAEIPYVGY